MIASLAHDSGKRGDLLSIKLATLKQFAYVKGAHGTTIMALKALEKQGKSYVVSHCFNGEIKFWKIGFNTVNNLELVLTVHNEKFYD